MTQVSEAEKPDRQYKINTSQVTTKYCILERKKTIWSRMFYHSDRGKERSNTEACHLFLLFYDNQQEAASDEKTEPLYSINGDLHWGVKSVCSMHLIDGKRRILRWPFSLKLTSNRWFWKPRLRWLTTCELMKLAS